MSKKKKVLFVATVVKKHINVFHLPYLQWFQEQGYETHVCARDDFDGEECIIPYCDVHYDIPFERSPISVNNIKAYKELKRIIDENEYDIIHCHTPVAAMLTRLAAIRTRRKGTKVIYTAHGFHFFKGAPLINWLVYYPVEWMCSWFTDVLITMNKEDYQIAKKKMKASKIEYVHGVGVDTTKFSKDTVDKLAKRRELGISENAVILLSVGELNRNKNHEVIIKAIAEIEDVHYCIAGIGNLESYLRSLAKERSISDRVHILGFRKDINDIYKVADLFCFPSYREGLSLSLMEAMSAGLPCAVSNIRGNIDLIQENIGGFVFEPEDVNRISNIIKTIVQNKEVYKEMGRANFKKVKQYDINVVKEEMINIYGVEK